MIRARESPRCDVCGSAGEIVYEGLQDVLYGAPGEWSFRRCSNPECGLLWLDPQPLEEDIGKAYARYFTHEPPDGRSSAAKRAYGRVRESYLRSGGLAPLAQLHPAGPEVFDASVMFLRPPTHGSSLLDIGCGGGAFMVRMRDRGWSVTGVETDPVAVERAHARGLDVRQGEVEGAELDDATFDAITMSHVIEHVHDHRRLLERCRGLLKPGGVVVILTPNSSGWGHRHFGRDWLGLDPPRHIHVFNPRNMRRLLASAGLEPTRIATLAINASAVWPASAAIRRARAASPGDRPVVSLKSTPAGIARQAAERLRGSLDPDAGEDLLAVSTRAE